MMSRHSPECFVVWTSCFKFKDFTSECLGAFGTLMWHEYIHISGESRLLYSDFHHRANVCLETPSRFSSLHNTRTYKCSSWRTEDDNDGVFVCCVNKNKKNLFCSLIRCYVRGGASYHAVSRSWWQWVESGPCRVPAERGGGGASQHDPPRRRRALGTRQWTWRRHDRINQWSIKPNDWWRQSELRNEHSRSGAMLKRLWVVFTKHHLNELR